MGDLWTAQEGAILETWLGFKTESGQIWAGNKVVMQNNEIIRSNKKELFFEGEEEYSNEKNIWGGKKCGRNKEKCQRYQDQNRWEKNKIKKWKKLIKSLSPDNDMRMQLEKRIKEVEGWESKVEMIDWKD